jgi:hypothetical protein
MRKHRIFRGIFQGPIFVGSIAISIAGGTSALAQEYRGTMEQQMACTPDVFRFCGAQIPDVNRIVACLRLNTPQLSGPCRAVFDSSANASPDNSPQPPSARLRQIQ